MEGASRRGAFLSRAELSELTATPRAALTDAEDLAVLVSVTEDVRTAFQATQEELPEVPRDR